ncbi:questin oxidase family protein [Caulobacter soli]|uniref:questin oxidase family protein n=1 Tax=Caulobacter soli TaxID=2708539 RepID=UPI0013ED12BD|nr:questin oxidase family protein [Caulobacter soli]
MSANVVEALLADRAYHIEFNGHLTNHAKHAVVALAGLGAAPEQVRAYYENYARLTTYGYGLEPARTSDLVVTRETWRDFLGRRRGFSALCAFFDAEAQRLGLDGVVAIYGPELLTGWIGAFTHATIHLGWALDAGGRWMAIEGLAYMVFTHVPAHAERAAPDPAAAADASPHDSLLRIARTWHADPSVAQQVQAALADTASPAARAIHPELARSGLQYRIARSAAQGHPLIYGLAPWASRPPQAEDWEALFEAVTLLYLAFPGDFVLLHLITALHAVETIAARLAPTEALAAYQGYWVGALGVAFGEKLIPKPEKLEALAKALQGRDDLESPERAADWRATIDRAVLEEEEHNPKLAYVLQKLWRRSGGRTLYRVAAAQFTKTPLLPPSFEQPADDEA